MSEWKKMEHGCLQGSSFGPLLWNMFQNNMHATHQYIKDTNLSMYVDGHQLYVMGKDHHTVGL